MRIISNPAFRFLKAPQSYLVSRRGVSPCPDGMNSIPSLRGPGNYEFPSHLIVFINFVLFNEGFPASRALVIFGLNALTGRSIRSDGSAVGAWDSTNAESLMRYTVGKGYSMYGWELGKNPIHSYMLICVKNAIHSYMLMLST